MGDSLVFAGFALAFLLNLMLGVQIWMYWGRSVPSKEHYPKEKEWIREKEHRNDAVLDMPHRQHQQDQPSFISVDVPGQSISTSTSTGSASGGRRWARKVD
jgi:mannose-P-dolichol utilization defect protein 1